MSFDVNHQLTKRETNEEHSMAEGRQTERHHFVSRESEIQMISGRPQPNRSELAHRSHPPKAMLRSHNPIYVQSNTSDLQRCVSSSRASDRQDWMSVEPYQCAKAWKQCTGVGEVGGRTPREGEHGDQSSNPLDGVIKIMESVGRDINQAINIMRGRPWKRAPLNTRRERTRAI